MGELVLDDAFFESKEVTEFRPCRDMKEFHSSCAQVLKMIRSRESKEGNGKNKLTDHLQVLNLSKLEGKLKPALRDFCCFLAHKSLSSKSFLDVYVLARSQEQPHALSNSSFYRSQVMQETVRLSEFSTDIKMIEQVNKVLSGLSNNDVLKKILSCGSSRPCLDSATFSAMLLQELSSDRYPSVAQSSHKKVVDTIVSLLKMSSREKQELLIPAPLNNPAVPQTGGSGNLELISLKHLESLWPSPVNKDNLASARQSSLATMLRQHLISLGLSSWLEGHKCHVVLKTKDKEQNTEVVKASDLRGLLQALNQEGTATVSDQ